MKCRRVCDYITMAVIIPKGNGEGRATGNVPKRECLVKVLATVFPVTLGPSIAARDWYALRTKIHARR